MGMNRSASEDGMGTEALVETLQSAGLSPYEAKAYVALLDLGTASATDIADASDVPAPRIYDVLQSLEDREYVETFEQSSLQARAHSTSEVVEDLDERASRLERAADEITERWERPELSAGGASIVSRFQTVLERAETIIAEANYLVLLSTTVEHLEQLQPALSDAIDRGVSVRVSVHTEEENLPDAAELRRICTEARHRPLPAPFVVIGDRRRASFAHHPGSYDRYGVLMNDRTHAYVFYWYFLTNLWEPWEVMYDASTGEYPVEYFDIRHLVRDLRAADWTEAGPVRVRVEGFDTDSGEERHVEGTIADIRAPYDGENASGFGLVGQVTIDLDVDGDRVSVGGWGAILEEIEGTRITLLDAPGNA